MLCWLFHLRAWLADLRLRCADRRYRSKVKVIDSLPATPEELKQAARERALNKIGEKLERYVDTT
jgi:hypothetical protein